MGKGVTSGGRITKALALEGLPYLEDLQRVGYARAWGSVRSLAPVL